MYRIGIIVGKMDSGGKKTLILQYFRHLDRNHFEFDFIVDKDSNSVPEAEIKELGGRIFYVTPYQNIVKYKKDVFKICKECKFDAVHSFLSTMSVFPLASAKKAGIRVRINESLSMANFHEFKSIVKIILRPFSKINATALAACGYDCAYWQFGRKEVQNGKVQIFNTVIDNEKYVFDSNTRIVERKKLGVNDKIVLGFIGRFEQQKNPLFLIDFVTELIHLNSAIVLILVGSGSLQDKILDRINKNGISKNVLFMGKTESIYELYLAMDTFLLPSLYEGLPVVGLEAQAVGLPIIFSNKITKQVSIDPGSSLFISLKKNAKEWAKIALPFILKTRNRRSFSKEISKHGFSASLETKKLENFYLSQIKGAI